MAASVHQKQPPPPYDDGQHEDVDVIDREWEDFARLVAQRQRDQAFYPSPLVVSHDEEYVSNNTTRRKA